MLKSTAGQGTQFDGLPGPTKRCPAGPQRSVLTVVATVETVNGRASAKPGQAD